MKILKICGVVAGIHALVIMVIFINPGCSSTTKSETSPADTVPAASPAPATAPVASSGAGAPAADQSALPAIVPVASGNAFYSPTRPNTPAAGALEPAIPVADVTPAATYVVKSGDSMWLIAHRNHIKVAELAAANSLKATATLRAGQKLILPAKAGSAPAAAAAEMAPSAAAAGTPFAPAATGAAGSAETKYTVKAGEALSTIAKRFKLTTGDLAARNNITDPRKIHAGQELIIPAGHVMKTGKKPKKGSAAAASAPDASSPAAAPLPGAPGPETAAPGPETTPSVSVPIIRIDGADNPAPSAAAPAK